MKTPICGMLLMLSLQAQAQNAIVINYVNGESKEISLDEIESLTFTTLEEKKEEKPDFPVNDGSTILYQTNKAYNLMLLLQKTDAQRAMSRTMFPELTDSQFDAIKKKADEICASCKKDADKITALVKWVRTNMHYETAPADPWTVFNNLKGVCQAYSNLLKVMLLTQGIPALGVNGYYVSGGRYAHAWTYAYANDTQSWYVCDATNSLTVHDAKDYKNYSHLQADFVDIALFEDDEFAYNLYDGYFNVCRVKKAGKNLVLPYSKEGFRIASFNPDEAIPSTVRNIYLGDNIETIGTKETRIGLKSTPGNDEYCYVASNNKELGSYEGVIYTRNYIGELNTICYIPSRMTLLKLMPMEKVEKNTILNLEGVEIIEFAAGTKSLEAYAIESCPNLRIVRVPKGCQVDAQAIYRCPSNVTVEYY